MTFFFYWLQILGAMLFGAGLGRLLDWAFNYNLRPNPLVDAITALAGIAVALAGAWAAAP